MVLDLILTAFYAIVELGMIHTNPQNGNDLTTYSKKTQFQCTCSNKIIDFIQKYLDPSRFVGNRERFDICRNQLNEILAFEGLEYGSDGKTRKIKPAQTLDEAEQRVNLIETKFHDRCIHHEVKKYCRVELMHRGRQNDLTVIP